MTEIKMETNESQVARNIVACRARYGYTQETLASKVGWSSRTIKSLEKEPFKFSIEKLNIISNAIGCNLNDFFIPLNLTDSE